MNFRDTLTLGLALCVAMAVQGQTPRLRDNAVILWNNAAIDAARDSNAGTLVMVRALAEMHTAMFDAWAQYDVGARPTLGTPHRRPTDVRTLENKREAISYAADRTLADLFPSDIPRFDRLMMTLGYEPENASHDMATPAGIGLGAASAVLEYRHHDGANQLGDLHPGAYSDYTGYTPVNGVDVIRDPDLWQPLCEGRNGGSVPQTFYMPQWGLVKPFGFDSVVELRPKTAPKTLESDPDGYISQARDIVDLANNLTERQKVGAEFWESSQGKGTNVILWNQFAQFVSHRDHHQLDDDVRLFFTLDNVMFDASIAAWDAKRHWESERPQTAIRVLAERNPKLFQKNWQPYLSTPPFPDFVSSHSVLSAAAAEVLKRFTSSDEFGGSYKRPAGVSGIEGKSGPAHEVVLTWATFTDAADESGMSRRYGGIHFKDADIEGRLLGRRVAAISWNKVQEYISGAETAKAAFDF
jgi:hypothetical protein